LKEKNLNLICAVGQAGEHLPKIIVLKKGKNPKLALVGKGIMYDTGGLSLKPTDNMMEMYYDMTGSAVVVGTFFGMIEKDIECYGVLALAENSIDSKSYRPGDIFSTAIGKTVEIGNTDAEGRLILADACYYIAKEKNVEEIICLATLTGAAQVALGSEYAALLTSHDKSRLEESWTKTGDKIHGLPFDDSYIKYLKSSRADLNNISSKGAGTITAWKFIETLIPKSVKFYGIDLAASLEKKDLKRSEIISNCLCVRSLIYYVNSFTK